MYLKLKDWPAGTDLRAREFSPETMRLMEGVVFDHIKDKMPADAVIISVVVEVRFQVAVQPASGAVQG